MAKRGEIDSVPLSRFGVLVAQLESIAASARQQPPDPLLCFDLLSELVSATDDEPKESIQQWQRKCEEALYSLLILGARRPVRRLASLAMGRVIAKGDGISIYSRVSSLQGWLVDSKRSEPQSCSGAVQCLGELYHLFGRRITSGLVETARIASKLMKFHEDFVRQDALQMLENALEGSGGGGASTAYSEAFRIIMRVGANDKSFTVRLAAARCLKTFASIGGPGLGITELENSIAHCVKALEDPVSSVRDAFAEALGALLALAMNPDAQVKQKGRNHPIAAKNLEDCLQKYLISPFTKVSGIRAKNLRIGLALSWVFFLQVFCLRYRFPDVELQEFSSQIMDMLQGNASVDAHALACVLYILRVGVTDQMTEPTQRSFLVLLGRKLQLPDYSPSVGVATLRILSYLLKTLGEVPTEFRDILDDTVVAALSHSSMHVRTEAALTLRSLAEVDPTCVGGLISYAVTTLHALRESFTMVKGSDFSVQLHSLHGQAAVLASLVFISPKLVLGYPARLPKSVFEVSKKMLTEFSRNPMAATVEKEAGWLLLASLIASMPKEELEEQVFDVLLLWADPFLENPEAYLKQKQDLNSELRVLTAGIEALTAFIKYFIPPTVAANNVGVLLQPVMVYLSGALSYISYLSAKPLQNIQTALDLFTIRTLLAYQSVSDPFAYKSEHSQILKICSIPFSNPSGSEESSCLRFLLDKRDACLGPWIPGRDWFEDELRAFDGGKDGLAPCLWEDEYDSFPQPEPIRKLLVNERLMCLATIFASQDNGGKVMLLNKIDQCLKTGRKQPWHAASITNACVALLAGLKALIASRPQTLGAEILSSIQSIFLGILADNETGPAHRRASSEGLGLLVRLANDIFTARMMRTLLGELVAATDPSYVGSIAFSLGCIHRSAGGMALSTLVPATVSSISLLAKSSNAKIQLWALHALLLTIEAAGLSYISQVQAMLFLAMEILLSEENGLADLRQELGRLINAIVAVLGPELAPGSTFFSRCKSFIAEISSCQETSSLVEAVRFTQQLVLFAPQAVSVHSNVQSLLPTLSSRQPSLRYLAVSTLRHLIEKDPAAIVDEKVEENLFSMLNEETDSEIGSLVRTTITRLLYTSCPSCPSRWLAIFHKMVLATSTTNASQKQGNDLNATPEGDGGLFYGEDDEDMISNSGGQQIKGSDSAPYINFTREKHLRYRTRMFAAECLSYLPTAVGTDLSHFDLTLVRTPVKGRNSSGDWLVLHLQELVSLAYQISTGPFEGMQPIGVRLLSIIMDKFGSIQDPELPGHLLLEQYQAQLFSAARSAVNMSSSPLLLEAGLQLATKISTSSIISGDRVALNRMFSFISRPLDDIKDLYYPSFAEWVACKIKIRLLAAHASIKCYVYQFLREDEGIPDEYQQLTALFSSSSSILRKYWISVLRDYMYICFCLHPKISYKPFLDGIQSPMVSSKVQNCLEEAWLMILQATSLDAVPVKFKTDSMHKSNPEDISKNLFVSGYSMVKLELCEYQFLWGLALLVLFQGKQAMMGSGPTESILHIKREYFGDPTTGNINDRTTYEILFSVFKSLSSEAFFSHEFLTSDLCHELLQVLIYTNDMPDSWDSLVVCLLSQIVHVCPDAFFEAEDFTAAVIELYCKCLFITIQSNDLKLDLQSKLYTTAETIVRRMKPKKIQMKLIMAFMSTSCECFRRASTDLCLPRIITFLQNILPFLKKIIREESDDGHDSTYIGTVLEAWANMLLFSSQECIRRTDLENRMSDCSKLQAKFLAFCLEESVALVRSICEILHAEQEPDAHNTLITVFDKCMKCMKDTLFGANMQVQTVGLHVLKSIAQRELAEGTRKKNLSFSLFFIGEFLGDIFHLIQHTLKERISKETVSIIEECLRLLLLFYTLSKESECSQGITMLLLEALLMVFSVSSDGYSQEINNVKSIVKKLVSHLVQIPSFAVQIKDVMLSMPVSLRQQLQDMIRASVAPGQNDLQAKKLNVQPQPSATEVHLSHAEDVAFQQNKIEFKEEDDDEDEDDDDDWDAFQSLPANNSSGSLDTESKPTLVSESSPKGADDDHQNGHQNYLVSEDAIPSLSANDPLEIEGNTEKERTSFDKDESTTSLQLSDNVKVEFDEYPNPQVSMGDETLDGVGDSNSQPPDEHLPSPNASKESNGRHFEGGYALNIGTESEEDFQKTYPDSPPANESEDFQRPADSSATGEGEIAFQKPNASEGTEYILRPSADSSPISEGEVDTQNITADFQLAVEGEADYQKSSPSDGEENIQKPSASEGEEYFTRPSTDSSPISEGEENIQNDIADLQLAVEGELDSLESSPSDAEEIIHKLSTSEGEEYFTKPSTDSLPGSESEVGIQIVTTNSQFAPGGEVDHQRHYVSEVEEDNRKRSASEGEEDFQKPNSDSPPAVESRDDFKKPYASEGEEDFQKPNSDSPPAVEGRDGFEEASPDSSPAIEGQEDFQKPLSNSSGEPKNVESDILS